MRHTRLTVIGGGLAGSEAAWQAAQRGIAVDLYEMRPVRPTEAHKTDRLAELVCSNSFGSDSPNAASRMLKDEVAGLGGMVLAKAREAAVPAGASLAVDRVKFADAVTAELEATKLITIHREELKAIPTEGAVIVATGPLTSAELAADLMKHLGGKSLYFYDAISPIVSTDSLDMDKMFKANRYGKGETADFLNIPLTKEQYDEFVADLLAGDVVQPHEFEKEKYFESCMPIEVIASRGHRTLAFGPMKPVGLDDPKTGRWAYAVIQLRMENKYGTAYNLVGFQTKLKYGEQLRVFRKLPGLENAEFLRLGSMHRNTFIDSPRVLRPTLQMRNHERVFVAGQLTGTEGYLESTATGLLAGLNATRWLKEEPLLTLPADTMLGALLAAITDETRKDFQPLNSNMGILPPMGLTKKDKAARNEGYATRAKSSLVHWKLEASLGA